MILASLIGLPLLLSLVLFLVKGDGAKRIALAGSVVVFLLTLVAYYILRHDPANAALLSVNVSWIKTIGTNFHVSLDGISMVMVLLTAFLTPLIILSSFSHKYEHSNTFYALILMMQSALIGVFAARDGFLFYMFWELALIPIYFICGFWGGENRGKITFKFFLYTLVGSLFMLAALIYVYLHTGKFGTLNFDIHSMYLAASLLSPQEQAWIFWGLFLAFAIKMPVFPFHTWQPDTYTNAPTAGTMLLSGIMLKMGTFGLIRWLIPLAPQGFQEWGFTALVLSIISIVYASIMAMTQKDYKRLIAYSSIAHVGLISAGVFALKFNAEGAVENPEALAGAVAQMFAHGISVIGLFLIADILFVRTGTFDIHKMGGIRNTSRQFTSLFLIIMMGAVALPLTSGFVGEFLLINGIVQYSAVAAAVAGLTIILGAVYMLRSFQTIMLGETNALTSSFRALDTNEKVVLMIVAVATLLFGIYPEPILGVINENIQHIYGNLN
jgi:NADH-quinone oxidoreductase subunit M